MRPLPQTRFEQSPPQVAGFTLPRFAAFVVLLAAGACTLGCVEGGTGSVAPSAPPPPSIQVSVTPRTGAVLLGNTLNFHASILNSSNSAVTWSVNGVSGGSVSAGMISASGVYTAPADLPASATVQITATSQADASESATALVTISSDIVVSVTPQNASVELGAAQTFHASLASDGHPDPTLRWSLSGAPCITSCGVIDANGNYIAPQILPASPLVTITATSVADPSRQATINATIASDFHVQLTAPSALQAGATAILVATLVPGANSHPSDDLSWSLSGNDCAGASCGQLQFVTAQGSSGITFSATEDFTAPSIAPQPATVTVTVTPQADATKKVQAVIAIQATATTPPPASGNLNIATLQPSSVYAGAASGFTLRVLGSGFVSASTGAGSALWIGGTPRLTSCDSANSCSASIMPGDVAATGNVSVQVQNPDGSASNTVSLVVAPLGSTESIVALTSSVPAAAGQDITVVDLTTTGSDTADDNVDLDVAALGTFTGGTNTCALTGNPIPVTRPLNGTTTADICLFSSSGLDATMDYTVSGPGDVAVIAKQPVGLGIIHLTLQIPATAAAGPRTLFIQNQNLDRAAAAGALDLR